MSSTRSRADALAAPRRCRNRMLSTSSRAPTRPRRCSQRCSCDRATLPQNNAKRPGGQGTPEEISGPRADENVLHASVLCAARRAGRPTSSCVRRLPARSDRSARQALVRVGVCRPITSRSRRTDETRPKNPLLFWCILAPLPLGVDLMEPVRSVQPPRVHGAVSPVHRDASRKPSAPRVADSAFRQRVPRRRVVSTCARCSCCSSGVTRSRGGRRESRRRSSAGRRASTTARGRTASRTVRTAVRARARQTRR